MSLRVTGAVSLLDDEGEKLLFSFNQLTHPWVRLDLQVDKGRMRRTYLSRPAGGGHTVLSIDRAEGHVGFQYTTVADDAALGELLSQQGYMQEHLQQLNQEGLAIPLVAPEQSEMAATLIRRLRGDRTLK